MDRTSLPPLLRSWLVRALRSAPERLRLTVAEAVAETILTRRQADGVVRRLSYLPLDPDRPWVVQDLARAHPGLPITTYAQQAHAEFPDAWEQLWGRGDPE